MAINVPEYKRAITLLRQEGFVHDCAIRERQTSRGRKVTIAYVAANPGFSRGRVHERLMSVLSDGMLPDEYVVTSALPYGVDGNLDESALEALPVIGEETLLEWERSLQSAVGTPEVV